MSSDITLAGGYNVAAYALLTYMVAQQCDLALGDFVWTLGDYHIYGNQIEDVKVMVNREVHQFPTLNLNKAKDLFSYEWSDIKLTDYVHSGKMDNLKVAI